jgi:4-alpha-glucanotransferase
MHLYCPAMLAIFPLQDLLAVDEAGCGVLYHENPWDEQINEPENRLHYWRYRMLSTIEVLLEHTKLLTCLKDKISKSGRAYCH